MRRLACLSRERWAEKQKLLEKLAEEKAD